ncbi:hypothetical protein H6G83_15460 [Anabaena azotica FACHB-119]|uniref:Uncharacterized protein n=1 Tax=Anabaena azotica FACHB-119 TaxID=947527 RepID=A0ABR8D6C0_9NOST|nr:hypothetical protein [Anabaena azotica FACHB-119]
MISKSLSRTLATRLRQPLAVFLKQPKFEAVTFTTTAFERFHLKVRLAQSL